MDKVLNSFINEYKHTFNEFFNFRVKNKIKDREDYKGIMDKIHSIYDKYPSIREFIEDSVPTTFSQEETEAFYEVYSLFEELHIIELLEAFKLGGREAYIFFEEQGMLNI